MQTRAAGSLTVPLSDVRRVRGPESRAGAAAPLHSAHGPPLGPRAARRPRGRRVPGRPRADDHGGRPAVDPGRPGRLGRQLRLDRAAQGELDHQRLPAGLHRDDAAGRPAGRPVGRPPAVPGRARRVHRRVGAGRGGPDPRPADRRAARPGGRRRRARPGRDGRRGAPVRRRRAAAGARRDRRADVPRHGRRPVRRRRDPVVGPPRGRARRRRAWRTAPLADVLAPAWRWVFYLNVPIGLVALVLAWAAARRLGDAAPGRPGGPRRARSCSASRSWPACSA